MASTQTDTLDLEELAALIDSRRGIDEVDDETLERLIAVFGLECLSGAFCAGPESVDLRRPRTPIIFQ